jgi:hypothetical protein
MCLEKSASTETAIMTEAKMRYVRETPKPSSANPTNNMPSGGAA